MDIVHIATDLKLGSQAASFSALNDKYIVNLWWGINIPRCGVRNVKVARESSLRIRSPKRKEIIVLLRNSQLATKSARSVKPAEQELIRIKLGLAISEGSEKEV